MAERPVTKAISVRVPAEVRRTLHVTVASEGMRLDERVETAVRIGLAAV